MSTPRRKSWVRQLILALSISCGQFSRGVPRTLHASRIVTSSFYTTTEWTLRRGLRRSRRFLLASAVNVRDTPQAPWIPRGGAPHESGRREFRRRCSAGVLPPSCSCRACPSRVWLSCDPPSDWRSNRAGRSVSRAKFRSPGRIVPTQSGAASSGMCVPLLAGESLVGSHQRSHQLSTKHVHNRLKGTCSGDRAKSVARQHIRNFEGGDAGGHVTFRVPWWRI